MPVNFYRANQDDEPAVVAPSILGINLSSRHNTLSRYAREAPSCGEERILFAINQLQPAGFSVSSVDLGTQLLYALVDYESTGAHNWANEVQIFANMFNGLPDEPLFEGVEQMVVVPDAPKLIKQMKGKLRSIQQASVDISLSDDDFRVSSVGII